MEHKILFSGTVGVGKTTAISAISEVPVLCTDVKNTDPSVNKQLTTVGLDYGELTLDNGDKLRLYGTPGQKRFDFMWEILSRGALGLVILIDNRHVNPFVDLDMYLDGFRELIKDTACVVAICRMETHSVPTLEQFSTHMKSRGMVCPVVPVDTRDPKQVTDLLELLTLMLEVKHIEENLS